MNSLILIFTYNTSFEDWENNGSTHRELNIYTELSKYFDKIYFVTYGMDDMKYQKKMPPNITILPKRYSIPNSLYSLLIPWAYRHAIKKSSWIKTNQVMGSWTAILIKIFLRKKIVIRSGYTESLSFASSNPIKQTFIWLIEFISYKLSDIAIVTSTPQKNHLEKRYGVNNIHIIPNGINVELFTPTNMSKPNSTLKLLLVGRLHKMKNITNLLTALKNLKDVKLTIIGNGPLREDILKFKNSHHINLTLISKVSNNKLPYIYNQADIYIQPSLYEGNPKTILEAMSCGLPVITSDVDGINNVILHKQNGYLCNTNSSSIREAILYLKNARILQEKLGVNARNYITENYSLHTILKKEIALYKKYESH